MCADYARSILHPRFDGEQCKQGVAKLTLTGSLKFLEGQIVL